MNQAPPADDESNRWTDWIYVAIFLVIFSVTWIVNLLLIMAIHKIKRSKQPHFMFDNLTLDCKILPNYYFIFSLSIANIFAVSFNPPIFIVFRWLNLHNNSLWRIYCLISISANTIFCNLAFLHVMFASLDTFLRLYSPKLYIFSQRKSTSFLKISAPWLVTGIQAGCQLSISNPNNLRTIHLQCLINDVNFLILRSVITFTIPLVACVILTILQIVFLRKLALINDENMRNLVSTYLYKAQLPETFALINQNSKKNIDIDNAVEKINHFSKIPRDVTGETLVSMQSMLTDSSANYYNNLPRTPYHTLDFTANHTGIVTDKWQSPRFLDNQFLCGSRTHISRKRTMWNFVYQREQMSVALNMASCIVAIGIWSPLILSTLTYRLCEQSSCFFQIPPERISDFQWWTFAGGAVYPIVYMCLDGNLRRSSFSLCNF